MGNTEPIHDAKEPIARDSELVINKNIPVLRNVTSIKSQFYETSDVSETKKANIAPLRDEND